MVGELPRIARLAFAVPLPACLVEIPEIRAFLAEAFGHQTHPLINWQIVLPIGLTDLELVHPGDEARAKRNLLLLLTGEIVAFGKRQQLALDRAGCCGIAVALKQIGWIVVGKFIFLISI